MPDMLSMSFPVIMKNGLFTDETIPVLRIRPIEEEITEHNPVSDVNFKQFTYKPVANQQDNVFSKEEIITLLTYLATIKDEPYALAIQFAFYLFIRVGELKAIKWNDINYNFPSQ